MLFFRKSYFWFFYLGACFILLTGIPEYLFVTPLCLIGFFYRPAWGFATRINRICMRIVLLAQPWFRADVKITLPESVRNHQQGVLIMANHRSHLDVMICIASITHLRVIAKKMLFFLPPYGHLLWLLQMIPIRKQSTESYMKAMNKLQIALKRNDRVLVFPEMTRCKMGEITTGRFHLAPFKAALDAQTLIVPVVFWGTDQIWGKGNQKITCGRQAWAESLPAIQTKDFASAQELAHYVQNQIDKQVVLMSQQYQTGSGCT